MRKIVNFFKKYPIFIFLIAGLIYGFEYYALGSNSYSRISDNMDAQVMRPMVYSNDKEQSFWMPDIAGGADRLSNMVSMGDLPNIIFQRGGMLIILSIISFIIWLELKLK